MAKTTARSGPDVLRTGLHYTRPRKTVHKQKPGQCPTTTLPERVEPTMNVKIRAACVLVMFHMLAALPVAQLAAVKMARVPRVYNAVITSEQQLLPSQVDPVVTPVLRPLPFFVINWPVSSGTSYYSYQTSSGVEANSHGLVDAAGPVESDGPTGGDDLGDATAVVKNNRPLDTDVPDVPPPPLRPTKAGKQERKKTEEFPPAPVGFAI
ncbi:uncharacterized protein LOC126834335 [Adelges cooleyi]|uniref:uncharacterized protein LOC126834335 n=1 Tax=Adelges cooleyi TaxID=133065 RepID=UPI00217FCA75|nr:uncharacterized protein LOC126834335 [Adelges cooleyi]XP_050422141.1 uncharacterized protein LOC126834335 [Adelges cooleyi]XP_050422142.1 uncharacterized protein LOC126834335 [Adelges cooleyi]XP_050422143.1 uncharacterized protein LOC126834335 [Adelges cooleyi]